MVEPEDPFLFGFGYGFGRTSAYAKQAAAFAAGVAEPNELSPSASLADPAACREAPGAPYGVVQNRKDIHPIHQAALR